MIGYGRACVAAQAAASPLGPLQKITFQRHLDGGIETCDIAEESLNWDRVSPFRNEDAVMILAYSIIMLTTNLHNPQVKDKMTKQQFLGQLRGVNDNSNFPGDFVSKVYDDVAKEEIKVMRPT